MKTTIRYVIQWILTGALILGLGYLAFTYDGFGMFFTGYGVVVVGVLFFFFLQWALIEDEEDDATATDTQNQ